MGVGIGGRGPWPLWIFTHGTNIVDKGLKVLFFGLCLLIFGLFFRWPPWKIFYRRPWKSELVIETI